MNLNGEEPTELKQEIQEFIQRMRADYWDYQSVGVWASNKIPSHFWTSLGWKAILREEGWTWQRFLKFMSYHTNDLIRWVSDEMSWDELIGLLAKDISNPVLRRMYFHG